MKLITDYNFLTQEYPASDFIYYQITEFDYPTYYIPIDKYSSALDCFYSFFQFVPHFSASYSNRFQENQIITTYFFKNLSTLNRFLTVECLSSETSDLFSVDLDYNLSLFTIDADTGIITFCLKGAEFVIAPLGKSL